jgi:hypothetical protein
MSLLRLVFWLGILVLLLPSDPQQQARLYAAATAAIERVTTFCDRNVKTCAVGAEAWAKFVKKAEFALRLVGDLIGGRTAPATSLPPPEKRADGQAGPGGKLTSLDLYEPPWRGAARQAGDHGD